MSKYPYIVIPNWNGRRYLEPCLHSLERQTRRNQIIVVDNGSTDGSVEFVRSHFPKVQLIALDKNHGFAGGVNCGIKLALTAGAEFIALFNNDAEAHPQWLESLVKRMQRSQKIGIVSGKFLRTNGRIDSVGEAMSIWGLPFPIGRDQPERDQLETARQVTAATGGASLYRTAMLKRVGLFDEAFFAYYEDVDLSLRAQSQGWQIWCEPQAVAHHQVGATSSKLKGFRSYHSLKNQLYLYDKNLPARLFWRYLPRKLISFTLSWLVVIKRGHIYAAVKAPLVVLATSPVLVFKRWRVQANRRISTPSYDKLLFHAAPPSSRTLQRLSKWLDRKYQ